MSTSVESKSSPLDIIKWTLVVLLIAVGVAGNSYFQTESMLYRVLALVGLAVVAALIALQTSKGKAFLVLAKEARLEIRKVVWPTRPETTQTTLIVIAFVLIVALILWAIDSLIGWIVSGVIG
ncbi:preprotein translocase subunit SecE [Allohahella sp. A8]|uniref:preprotein translocase subunit SecE n=1 Tax=Allohahella sp. A8 TaxID=3141461 RepID=UPI000C0ADBA2|nr:preprotein translocase subunit SecE [Hahellaceae bacterium]